MDPNALKAFEEEEDEHINFVVAICAMAGGFVFLVAQYYYNYIDRGPYENTYHKLRVFVKNVSTSDEHCKNLLRMNVACFENFVDIFIQRGMLKATIHCSVKEQVAIFLHTTSLNQRVRSMKCYKERSGETVGWYFNIVLDALLDMYDVFVKLPLRAIPRHILENPRWYL